MARQFIAQFILNATTGIAALLDMPSADFAFISKQNLPLRALRALARFESFRTLAHLTVFAAVAALIASEKARPPRLRRLLVRQYILVGGLSIEITQVLVRRSRLTPAVLRGVLFDLFVNSVGGSAGLLLLRNAGCRSPVHD